LWRKPPRAKSRRKRGARGRRALKTKTKTEEIKIKKRDTNLTPRTFSQEACETGVEAKKSSSLLGGGKEVSELRISIAKRRSGG